MYKSIPADTYSLYHNENTLCSEHHLRLHDWEAPDEKLFNLGSALLFFPAGSTGHIVDWEQEQKQMWANNVSAVKCRVGHEMSGHG